MSFEASSCFLLRCDGCGVSFDEEFEVHFASPDPADLALVDHAEGCGWTTDGERWHCQGCPELRSAVCRPCRAGFHNRCEDPDCACPVLIGQTVLPGLGEEAPRG